MDPITIVGVTASVIACIQLTGELLKRVQPSDHSKKDLQRFFRDLCGFRGAFEGLKSYLEFNEEDGARLSAVHHLQEPLRDCKVALTLLEDRLKTMGFIGRYIVGGSWDKKLKKALRDLEEARKLFELVLLEDQQTITKAIERYVRNVGEDVRDTQITINENGKRLVDIETFSRESHIEAGRWQSDNKASICRIGNEVSEHYKLAKEWIYHSEQEENYKKRQQIITWLSTLNFSAKQNDFLARRQEGTGKWLLETDVFNKWLDGTERILWCPGLPGSGKTIFTSIIVNYLEQLFEQKDVAVAYIYCNYKEQEDQTAVNLIASLLGQLLQRITVIPDDIMSLYNHHNEKQTRPTLSDYSTLLQSEVRRFLKVFIIVDALDECADSNGTRDSFLAEIRKLGPTTHFLATSRHSVSIDREFEKAAHLEIYASGEDVRRYVETRIEKERRLACHVKADPALQETVINSVTEKAKGMFLLAQLHMDSLAKKVRRKDIREAVKNLPLELDGTYDEAMQRIESQNKEEVTLAKNVLSWISYALRPLTIKEIQHALAVEPEDTNFDEDAMPDEDILVSVCAGLVTIDQESNIIRLVHYTIQEYFERIRMTRFPCAQTSIATTCLVYISFDVFAEGYCRNDQEMEIRMHKYPLLEYSAKHWGYHAREGSEEAIKELALKFLDHHSKLMCSTQVMYLKGHQYSGYSQRFPKHVIGLHTAASMGLAGILRLLIEREGVNVNSKDSLYGRTPLSLAAGSGHEDVVRLLVKCEGIDLSSKDSSCGRTPLSWAAENGYEAVVGLLAECEGVDVNSKDFMYGRTPLLWAAENGYEAVMRLLVEHEGVDVNSKGFMYGETPLLLAARNGHEAVVRLLAEREGVDLNSKDSEYGQTPLSWAAENGHETTVRLLFEHEGVDVNSKNFMYGETPLLLAARNGHEAVVRLLTEREGVDLNSKDSECGQTPLLLAAENGHEAVVRLLVEREGVDVDTKDSEYGRTPLSLAAENGQEAVVRLLVKREGVDVNTKDSEYGRTPLSLAAEYGHEAVVRLLVEHEGVDVNIKDSEYGQTPLSLAAESGHEAVVRLLAECEGVDVNSKDSVYGRTPLSWAAENGHEAVVRLLTPLTPDF